VAFLRRHGGQAVIAVVPRLTAELTASGPGLPPVGTAIWQDTRLNLPSETSHRSYRNVFTGEPVVAEDNEGRASLGVPAVLATLPVALLLGVD
jgi:(1->4)-alpha-D-glucan 1-alpha-D-glucosylmutase